MKGSIGHVAIDVTCPVCKAPRDIPCNTAGVIGPLHPERGAAAARVTRAANLEARKSIS